MEIFREILMQFVLNIFSYTLKESPNLNQRRKIAGFLIGHRNFYADRIPHEPFPAIKKIPVYLKMGETQGKVWFQKKGVTGNEEDFVADLESETRKNTDFR